MRHWLANSLESLSSWLKGVKGGHPEGVTQKSGDGRAGRLSDSPAGDGTLDVWRRRREPSKWDLLRELKGTAWACASINASVLATFTPKLYVRTGTGEREPRMGRKALPGNHPLAVQGLAQGATVEEVTEHPLLDLFRQVNP